MNVTELMKRIKTHIGEKATAPDEGGTEWNWYLNMLNQAQRDWQEAYEWPQLYKEVNTFNGGATLSLPTDFRKLDGPVRISISGETKEYPQINPEERSQYSATEKYCYILGNDSNGYSLIVSPGTTVSTSSIFYSYWSNAATLASPADQSMIPNPEYLVEKTLYYYWRIKDDNRLSLAEAKSQEILAKMLEFENTKGHAFDDRVKTYEEKRTNFRLGRD